MRRCFLSAAIGLLLAPWALAGAAPLGAADQVIADQLTALAGGHARLAFSYAAPELRAQFKTAANFFRMVEKDYPAVIAPLSYSFGSPRSGTKGTVQPVDLLSRAGQLYRALYLMQRQPDGSWRIGGVALRRVDLGPTV